MSGRIGVVGLVVGVIALAVGGFALVQSQGADDSAWVTTDQLKTVSDRLDAAHARLEAAGGSPVVNAAKLDGLTSDAFVHVDAQSIGQYNCLAMSMGPSLSGQAWNVNRYGVYLTGGEMGYFNCAIHLPDGASITGFRASVRDNSATGQVVCYMLAVTTDIALQSDGYTPAYAEYTGLPETPGDTVLTDDTIKDPVVNNAKYGYMAECELTGAGPEVAIRSVTVLYGVGATR